MAFSAARPAGFGPRARRAAVTVTISLIVAVGASGCGVPAPAAAPPAGAPSPSSPASAPTPTPSASVAPAAVPAVPAVAPAAVTIAAIGLSEPLIDLGIQRNGSMEVPSDFGDVGWFTGGGKPGGPGPTVIAGHVDSVTAPAVFARLGELVVGDRVQVTDVAGATFEYEIYEVGDYPKADFPTARVFGAVASDEVRLITCTGLFDSSTGHYLDNRVVFGKRV